MKSLATAVLIAAIPTFALGCRTTEPRSPDASLAAINPPQPPDLGRGAPRLEFEVYNMFMNENVRSACSGPSPFFKFDSSKPTAADRATMSVLASCMKTGPLRDKSILLVGRTDPRGSEFYNAQLGLDRARKVKAYLIAWGVDADRVRTASLGKDDASPSPADWPSDRRVEIRLMEN